MKGYQPNNSNGTHYPPGRYDGETVDEYRKRVGLPVWNSQDAPQFEVRAEVGANGRAYVAGLASPVGMKFDGGKPRFDLLEFGCPDALLGVVKVLTWAVEVKGYEPHSWQGVEDGERRYAAAQRRHDNALARGETHDPESGFPHEWHIAANALFRAQLQHNAQAVPA
ncbi:dATP/dGTP diphosphohydrolase domain-containing protein [Burkholderia cepacia]|uniref:dATP/dGTP diphosphohydrolase domain-containing protein n=1 Tax=Burkholderia cepacia TaxID=292 RepID=UPI000A8D941A|nr:dATP/dGTP diphosphohydrolase domain-containing protein [Burkholderia cepacia]